MKLVCLFIFLGFGFLTQAGISLVEKGTFIFSDMADASAATWIDDKKFVVASDEDSVLRIYDIEKPGPPCQFVDISGFLNVDRDKPETDIEACTRLGDRIYFITSHGRNKNGRERVSRERFFAIDVGSTNGNEAFFRMVGKPYTNLLNDLLNDPELKKFNLAEAAQKAPKSVGGLNIEGLCASTNRSLLIGFRNPIPEAKALIVPMLNPEQVIQGLHPKFGKPILLDLGGRGIRDMTFWNNKIWICAGPADEQSKVPFKLFLWDLADTIEPIEYNFPKGFHAEGLFIWPRKSPCELMVISDDGTRKIEGKANKDLPRNRQTFRGIELLLKGNLGE